MGRPLNVLVVEDSEDDALLLLGELRKGGFEPRHRIVQDREALLDALRCQRWDIVLSDYAMPHFDGLGAYKLIREEGLDVPFIFVSGHIGEERAVEAMRHGVSDYLHKDRLARLAPAVIRELADAESRRQRVEMERALRSSEERLRRLAQNAPDIIYEFAYLPAPHFAFVSPAAEAITGYSPQEHYADPELWLKIVHQDDHDTLAAMLRPGGAAPPGGQTLRWQHRDGRLRWVEQRVVPIHDGERHVGIEGIIRDITDRKQLEDQFLAAQRMEAIGRLAGGIAHDFNNMLTVMAGYCSLLRRKLDMGDQRLADVAKIENATERSASLVRQLLAFSRRQPVTLQRVDLNRVLTEFSPMLGRVIGEDIQVEIRLAERPAVIHADRSQLEQILMNLVVNARDAMPTGGRLTIETDVLRLDSLVSARPVSLKPGAHVRLTVSDTGTGMEESVRARIFDPFFTTKEVGQGTGLGLSTVYGIVKQMDGEIWVHSEPGRGSSFKLYVPQAQGDDEDAAQAPGPPSLDGQETILLVEDEPMVREAAQEILAAHGYRVLPAASGEEAQQLSVSYAHPIDLLLTDLLMPGMSGVELAEHLRARRQQMRVLYTTGYTEATLPGQSAPGGLDPILQKPFSSRELLLKVRRVLSAPAQQG